MTVTTIPYTDDYRRNRPASLSRFEFDIDDFPKLPIVTLNPPLAAVPTVVAPLAQADQNESDERP
jgi:hypothetical protein